MRRFLFVLVVFLVHRLPAQQLSPSYNGPQFTRTEVAPGVHAFVFDNMLGDQGNVDGTSIAIINERDVVVVDATWSPPTARRVIAEIRKLTPNPVRYVINTHWHGDHWLGNQAYQEEFPGVEFIGHRNTVLDAREKELKGFDEFRSNGLPDLIASYEAALKRSVRRLDGKPYTAADSALMLKSIASFKWSLTSQAQTVPLIPTMTITDSLVLERGDREIVIKHVGRANTRGDLAVWLPKEKVLITGDMLVNPAPYSFFSYLGEWKETLGRLRTLPATTVIPGHGAIARDWAYFDMFVELLDATLQQAKAAVAKGMDLEATRKAVDLSAMRQRFTQGNDAIGRAFDAFFIAPAVERAWLEARGELDKAPPN